MISQKIGESAQIILRVIVKILAVLHINPNHLTFLGFVMSIATAYAFARGRFGAAGVILIIAGLFDMVDGMVARKANSETPFGAFFDSVMDRYSDLIMYLGLIIWYGQQDRMNYVVLVGVVMMGSVLTSYTRARAESLIPRCKVGFLERPERIVLLIIGSFYYMDPVLWVIAIFSNWTVVHRILYTRAQTTGRPSWVIAHQAPQEEEGAGRQEPGDRRQETGARRQETGDRRQETGAASQEPEVST
ncbi:CDP-alcohol phosphatidyltransferase family protein [Acidobacteria bacterium AH-259-A15]|nr:CDP-alcohol phosphatidyltransferase family protein [Acidobacteria bacterium AH-259-A15]